MSSRAATVLAMGGAALVMVLALLWPMGPAASDDPAFGSWRALPRERRTEYVRIWNDLQRRADGPTVLKRAAAFEALDGKQKAALRRLRELQEQVLRQAPAAKRAQVLRLPAAARAVDLARMLEETNPAAVAEIRGLFAKQ